MNSKALELKAQGREKKSLKEGLERTGKRPNQGWTVAEIQVGGEAMAGVGVGGQGRQQRGSQLRQPEGGRSVHSCLEESLTEIGRKPEMQPPALPSSRPFI